MENFDEIELKEPKRQKISITAEAYSVEDSAKLLRLALGALSDPIYQPSINHIGN